MVEPPTLVNREFVRHVPESPARLLRYEPPTEKVAIQYAVANCGGLEPTLPTVPLNATRALAAISVYLYRIVRNPLYLAGLGIRRPLSSDLPKSRISTLLQTFFWALPVLLHIRESPVQTTSRLETALFPAMAGNCHCPYLRGWLENPVYFYPAESYTICIPARG